MLRRTYELTVPPDALADFLEALYPDIAREEWEIVRAALPLAGHLTLTVHTKHRVEADVASLAPWPAKDAEAPDAVRAR